MTVISTHTPTDVPTDEATPFVRQDTWLDGAHFSVLKGPGDVSDMGKPILIFSHANGFNAQTYRQIFGPLCDEYVIWMWDMRGHGLSRAPADPARLKGWTRFRKDLTRLIDGIDRPVYLAGHSLGGMTSLLAAVAEPDKVQGVLALDPVTMPLSYSFFAGMMKINPLMAMPLEKQAKGRRAVFDSQEAALAAYQGRGAFKTWPDDILRDYLQGGLMPWQDGVKLACDPQWEAAIYRTVPLFFTRQAYKLRCPVRILHASYGSTFPDQTAASFKWQVKNLDIEKVADSSHFLPMEYPAVVQQAVREFVGL